MSDKDAAHGHGEQSTSEGWKTAATMLQDAAPITVPEGASAMTVHVEWGPGDPGTPPHRHSGPAFGYVLEGAVRFELEGEPERVIEAGGTFWEPGGDVIHYQDGNALTDARTRFVVTMMCAPGKPMLELVGERELAERAQLRAPRPTG
ncbi:cupin domain-containing protein [Streptomyces sp. NPDC048254]|uniref:cupin domain-containing protein n=1 Tax=Streptomyces sp. NPDC048254 TaxID=3365525 RepID=UPI00371AAA9F